MTCINEYINPCGKKSEPHGEECEQCCDAIKYEILEELKAGSHTPCVNPDCDIFGCIGRCSNPYITKVNDCRADPCRISLFEARGLFLNLLDPGDQTESAIKYLDVVAKYSHGMSGAERCFCKHEQLCVKLARQILGLKSSPI